MSIKARTSRRQCSAQRVSVRFTAASALAVACGLASAQSGVTLYGRVAGGIDYTNKIDTGSSQSAGRLQYGSNQWGTSMWGLRASEDLGGGLKAVMNLENGFTSADGVASGGLFNRYAVAGLSSSTYGTLLVGRAMGIPDSEVYTIDPMGLQFMSAATFQGNRTWGSRTKAITYNSPVWGGWSFRAQAGLNGTAGNFNVGRQLAASIGYQNGPLMLKGFYEDIRDSAGQFTNLYTASRLYTAGGTYQIGDAKLFGGYSQIQSSGNTIADADNPTGATRQQTYWIGIQLPDDTGGDAGRRRLQDPPEPRRRHRYAADVGRQLRVVETHVAVWHRWNRPQRQAIDVLGGGQRRQTRSGRQPARGLHRHRARVLIRTDAGSRLAL